MNSKRNFLLEGRKINGNTLILLPDNTLMAETRITS